MIVRVVVYAEGPADDAGQISLLPASGEPLQEEHLGPVHLIVRRTIVRESQVPQGGITFVRPLLTRRGRRHQASELLKEKILRQLLTWPVPRLRPALAVVVVDEDGEVGRRRKLHKAVQDIQLLHVIAVPVRELEAWLIGDVSIVRDVLANEAPAQPDKMPPRGAKQLLEAWTSNKSDTGDRRERRRAVRLELARRCDLGALDRLEAFAEFAKDVRQAMTALAG